MKYEQIKSLRRFNKTKRKEERGMRKKRKICASLAVLMMLALGIVVMAAEQPEVDGDIDFQVDGRIFKFKEYALGVDSDGEPAVILTFDYTNNSEESNYAFTDFSINIFQDGISRDSAYLDFKNEWAKELSNFTTAIRDGASLTVCHAFSLDNISSSIDVEVKEAINWDETQKMTIDISKYSGEIPKSKVETEAVKTYESEYTEMSENYAALQSEHEALQSEYDELLEKYNGLLESQSSDVEETGHDKESGAGGENASTEEMLQSELTGIEKNTNDALNKVIEIAKNNASIVTDEQISEAISAIRDNHPQYYNGSEQMELYMYYGYLLDFAFDDPDPRSELGMDTYQAIKYVYRGSETVLDSATKANLDQIEKDLQKIN